MLDTDSQLGRRDFLKASAVVGALAGLSGCTPRDASGPVAPLFEGEITGNIQKTERGYDLVLLLGEAGSYRYQSFKTHKHRVELEAERDVSDPADFDKVLLDQFANRRHLVQIASVTTSGEISIKVLSGPSTEELRSALEQAGGGLMQAFKNYKYSVEIEDDLPFRSTKDSEELRISDYSIYSGNRYRQILKVVSGRVEAARVL